MRRLRGDTIIELMLAFSIFSLAAVGTIAIMNKGLAMSQQSLEMSLVRAQMDGQAETIRYLRDTSNARWDDIVSNYLSTDIAPLAPSACLSPNEITSRYKGFFLQGDSIHASSANFSMPATYARAEGAQSYGIWVQIAEAERNTESTSSIAAYDVYIHACWDSLTSDSTPATLGTIVRIYDK